MFIIVIIMTSVRELETLLDSTASPNTLLRLMHVPPHGPGAAIEGCHLLTGGLGGLGLLTARLLVEGGARQLVLSSRSDRVVAGSEDDWEWLAKSGGSFDVVIDDGGHSNTQILTTCEVLWPALKPGQARSSQAEPGRASPGSDKFQPSPTEGALVQWRALSNLPF